MDKEKSIKTLLTEIAHFDMEKEFMSADSFCEGNYEDAKHLYRSLPSCIVNVVARGYLDGDELAEILKTVKIKHKKVEKIIKRNPQVSIQLTEKGK